MRAHLDEGLAVCVERDHLPNPGIAEEGRVGAIAPRY
jgi:hypothetical protein